MHSVYTASILVVQVCAGGALVVIGVLSASIMVCVDKEKGNRAEKHTGVPPHSLSRADDES